MPDVTGKKQDEATAALQAAGLKVERDQVLRQQGAPAAAEGRRDRRAGHHRQDPGELRSRALRALAARRSARTSRSRAAWPRAACAYTDAVGARRRAGVRRQPARLEADRRRPGAGRRCSPPAAPSAGVPSFIHTPFLVNVGSPTEATVEQSIASIAHNLARGAQLGCAGVVVHAGSAVGEDRYEAALRQLHERLLPVLDALPDGGPRLLIEPTAGGGKSLAATVEDLGPYLAALENHPLVGVCFDTCHAWAAGHDLAVPGGMTATLDALRGHRRPRPARAGARQRLAGRVRLQARPAHDDRRGLDRRRRRSPSCWPTRRWPASRWWWRRPSELDGSPSAGHARDIALLCSLTRIPAAA